MTGSHINDHGLRPKITTAFKGGRFILERLGCTEIVGAIDHDGKTEFRQWFNFKVQDVRSDMAVIISNAGRATYPDGWINYDVCVSYDRRVTWQRIVTSYDGFSLKFRVPYIGSEFEVAYFPPFDIDQCRELDLRIMKSRFWKGSKSMHIDRDHEVQIHSLGSHEHPETKPAHLWIIARQHPGESMASWCVDGMVELLDLVGIRNAEWEIHIVSNACPSGVSAGYHRTDVNEIDLNRAWDGVYAVEHIDLVKSLMGQKPPALLIDVHGEECIPLPFFVRSEGIPAYDTEMQRRESLVIETALRCGVPIQNEFRYPEIKRGQADLRYCRNFVAQSFSATSLTLEMPFKDYDPRAGGGWGWGSESAMRLGRNLMQALLQLDPSEFSAI